MGVQPDPNAAAAGDPAAAAAATSTPAAMTESNAKLLLEKLEEQTVANGELQRRLAELENSGSREGHSAASRSELEQLLANDRENLKQIARSDEPLAPFARILLATSSEATSANLTVREKKAIDKMEFETAAERGEFEDFYDRNRGHFSGPDAAQDAFEGRKLREERKRGAKTKREQDEQNEVNGAAARMPAGGAPQTPSGGGSGAPRPDGKQVVAFSWYLKNQTPELIAKKDVGELIVDYSR